MSEATSSVHTAKAMAATGSPSSSNNSQYGFDPEATDEANYLRSFGQTRKEMQAAVASYTENIRLFRMEEPQRGSRYHFIYLVTAQAYRVGARSSYVPDYERQPDPKDSVGVAAYWESQLREYADYLAAGGRPVKVENPTTAAD